MTENRSDKMVKLITYGTSGVAGLLMMLLAAMWGNLLVAETGIFVILAIACLALTSNDPPESRNIYFIHPVMKGIVSVTLLLMCLWFSMFVLYLFRIYLFNIGTLAFVTLSLLDLSVIIALSMILRRKFNNNDSPNGDILHTSET